MTGPSDTTRSESGWWSAGGRLTSGQGRFLVAARIPLFPKLAERVLLSYRAWLPPVSYARLIPLPISVMFLTVSAPIRPAEFRN